MDTKKFRNDILDYLATSETTPFNLACSVGIESSAFYKFLSGKIGISATSAFKLWPFIYREPVRIKAIHPSKKRGVKDAA